MKPWYFALGGVVCIVVGMVLGDWATTQRVRQENALQAQLSGITNQLAGLQQGRAWHDQMIFEAQTNTIQLMRQLEWADARLASIETNQHMVETWINSNALPSLIWLDRGVGILMTNELARDDRLRKFAATLTNQLSHTR